MYYNHDTNITFMFHIFFQQKRSAYMQPFIKFFKVILGVYVGISLLDFSIAVSWGYPFLTIFGVLMLLVLGIGNLSSIALFPQNV